MKKLIFAALAFALIACGQAKQEQTETTDTSMTTATATATAANETMSTAPASDTASTAATTAATTSSEKPLSDYENKVAELHTTAGEIDIRFFPDVAPNHVRNFIDLAKSGFYNGTKFHRVIPGFMIQGGDPNTKTNNYETWGTGGSGKTVNAEFSSVKHTRGIVSMARSSDPNSASSQFFIMVADYPSLNGQYSAFGEVTKGMDVVDKIVSAKTTTNDRPINPTTIQSITFRDAKPDEKGPTPK